MYQVGDYLVYGSSGVCKVLDVREMDNGLEGSRLYYTLTPCSSKGSTIFTPVDNKKVVMRPVMSRDQALELMGEIPQMGLLEITDEKKRELEYKSAYKTCEPRQLVRMIKTIYVRKQQRIRAGKKVTAQDEKYYRMAEDALYGELGLALGMNRSETKFYVEEYTKESIQNI